MFHYHYSSKDVFVNALFKKFAINDMLCDIIVSYIQQKEV